MARIAPLDPDNLSPEQKEVYDAIASGPRGAVVGPLAVWLNRASLADKAQKLGQYCRYDSSLEPRLSELAILVTARVWDAAFEWQSHEPPARAAGLGHEIIESLRGHTTGYAVPQFVIDAPGGGGKVPVNPNYVVERTDNQTMVRNYEGKTFVYPEPRVLEPAEG